MPDKKSIPKKRYERQRKAREIRRALAAVTSENSNPQAQCPLFSFLPAELRFHIFSLVLSQTQDLTRPIRIHSISPLYRPAHTFHTKISTSLLLTCRKVYHEAHAIPLRSATHHFRFLGSMSWLYQGDTWLHHVTKQRGLDLYHLHDNLVALRTANFNKFLLPHLHWRKITWTVCVYLLPPLLAEYKELDTLASTLAELRLPSSCQEVTLELETREDLSDEWGKGLEQASACKKVSMLRKDGVELALDDRYSVRYKWVGSGQARWGTNEHSVAKQRMVYYTTRLCWRAKVPRREYMSYDQLDCLRLEGCEEVKEISPLQ